MTVEADKPRRNLFARIISHKVFQTFGIYTGSSIINKALPFVLLPVMTKYLDPAEYGTLAIYTALISFALPFIGMSMQFNITREFYRLPKEKIAKLMSNLIFVLVLSTSIVMLTVMVYGFFFPDLNGIPILWLYSIPIITFLSMINQFNLVILRNEQRAVTYGVFEVSSTVLQLLLSLLFVVALNMGWEGRAYPIGVCSLVFGIIGFMYLIKTDYLTFDFDPNAIREALRIALPMIPYALGGMIIFFSDRFFIDHFAGKAAVGIYAAGYAFGMIVTLFKDAFTKAWAPWMFRNLAHIDEEKKIKIVRFTYAYMIGIVLLAVAVTLISYVLLQFMTNERYHGAKEFIIWIALANAVNGMYSVLTPYSTHLGRTKILAGVMFLAAIVNLIGNYFLIKMNGIVGAAQATLLAFTVSFIVNWMYVQKIYPMPWFDKRVFDWKELSSILNPKMAKA